MPEFEKVARLAIADLVEPSTDAPVVVPLNDTLKEVAELLSSTSTPGILVKDENNDQIVSFLTSTDVASAVSGGMTPDTPIAAVVASRPKPVTVRADLPLEDIPSQIGQLSVVVVVDEDGKPKAVVDRKDLAERVLKLR